MLGKYRKILGYVVGAVAGITGVLELSQYHTWTGILFVLMSVVIIIDAVTMEIVNLD
jgi:sulfite exporter TauE/SafE